MIKPYAKVAPTRGHFRFTDRSIATTLGTLYPAAVIPSHRSGDRVATLPPRPHPNAPRTHTHAYVTIAVTPYDAVIAVATDLNVYALRYFKLLRFGRGGADEHRGSRNNGRGGRSGENDPHHVVFLLGVNTQHVTRSNQQSSIVDLN
jgi:hypothetical protein